MNLTTTNTLYENARSGFDFVAEYHCRPIHNMVTGAAYFRNSNRVETCNTNVSTVTQMSRKPSAAAKPVGFFFSPEEQDLHPHTIRGSAETSPGAEISFT